MRRTLLPKGLQAVTAMVGVGLVTTPLVGRQFADWLTPVNLGPSVNSAHNEMHPAISPDNLSLYFASDRPGGVGNYDLWVSRRANEDLPWEPPQNLGASINSTALESGPAFDPSGHILFFGSERSGCGGRDLWVSFRKDKRDDFGWQTPVNLGCGVNSSAFDDGPTYFDDDLTGLGTLYFISSRPGGVGDRDVWVTIRNLDGSFSTPENAVELNSSAIDARPTVRRDGLEFFLTSQRPGSVPVMGTPSPDIWVATRASTSDLWSPPLNVETLNTSAADGAPALSRKATTLYFQSTRPGGFGALDLYVTTRAKRSPDE